MTIKFTACHLPQVNDLKLCPYLTRFLYSLITLSINGRNILATSVCHYAFYRFVNKRKSTHLRMTRNFLHDDKIYLRASLIKSYTTAMKFSFINRNLSKNGTKL